MRTVITNGVVSNLSKAARRPRKPIFMKKGYTFIMTHSLKELLTECTRLDHSFHVLATDARTLDMFYIPTRYPNGLGGDLAPTEF